MRNITSIPVLVLSLLLGSTLSAQQEVIPDQASCDCAGRKLVTDTVIHVMSNPPGPGRVMEFLSEPKDPFSFEIEHHTVWLEFVAPGNCRLELDIVPEDTLDNLDFLLFTYMSRQTCDSIGASRIPAIRSVVSNNDYSLKSSTGLSDTAIDLNIAVGQGLSYAHSIDVRKGWRYVLVVDKIQRSESGFTIHLKYRDCGLAPGEKPVYTLNFRMELVDTFGNALTGDILVKQRYSRAPGPDVAVDTVGHEAVGVLTQSAYYEVIATVPGYLTYKEGFVTDVRKDSLVKVLMLKMIEVGSSDYFEPIYFRKNSDKFETGSTEALKNAIKFLKDNPDIIIEIQGHVNRPENLAGWIGDTEDKTLGELRAKAVKQYLVKKGIDKDRIEIRNMRNSAMVYPYARNQDQMSKNRRAEILIIKAR